MKELEDRLSRMESVLQSSSNSATVEVRAAEEQQEGIDTPLTVVGRPPDVEIITYSAPSSRAAQSPAVSVGPEGSANRIWKELTRALSPVGFSTTPPDASPSRSRLTTPPLFQQSLAFQQIFKKLDFAKRGGYYDAMARTVFSPVLAAHSELWLLEHTVENIFQELPMFNAAQVLERLRQPSTFSPEENRIWEACMNSIRANAIPSRIVNSEFGEVAVLAWAFFKNAYAVLPEFVIHRESLLVVQGLLSMTMFLRLSTDARTMSVLLSLAVRILTSIGSRGPGAGHGARSTETATQGRLLWIAYILDTEISSGRGVPAMLQDEDVDIDLAAAEMPDDAGIAIFRLRVELATIQSAVRRRLYTPKALKQTHSQLIDTVQELRQLLEVWQAKLPAELVPRGGRLPDEDVANGPVVALHLAFYNTLSLVCWAARRLCGWDDPAAKWLAGDGVVLSNCPLFFNVENGKAAARGSIELFSENVGGWQFVDFRWVLAQLPPIQASTSNLLLQETSVSPSLGRPNSHDVAA